MAKARSKSKSARSSRPRASWKGQLSFGLVSIAVEAYNALDRTQSDIHFNQLHAKCHKRIRYQKVCPVHGEVANDEIVSGYEHKKGKYIEVNPEELEEMRSEDQRALKVEAFISPDTIDPIYYDGRMYYLVPENNAAEEAYGVFMEAMEREERYGIGQFVFSGKEQLVLIRPYEGVLHMAMLNYEVEIRPPKQIMGSVPRPKSATRQVRMAQSLIEEWSEDSFDFSKYEDHYREQLQSLIDAKVNGKEIVEAPDEEDEHADIVNLMDALKKSLAQGRKRTTGPSRNARKRTRPKAKRRSA